MSGLELDLTGRAGAFRLEVAWRTASASLGIFGPSGAGKTVLLETIAGLRRTARGRIRLGARLCLDSDADVNLPPEARAVGYVPQDALLFPHRDVWGNVLSGRRRTQVSGPAPDPERVLGVLELDPLRHRPVDALSGGEKQRVALARALCSGPEWLLLDEPLAGLDVPLRRRILPFLLRVREEFALPTVLVSHDPTELRILSDEILVLSGGRAMASGPTEKVLADPRVFPMAREEGFENALLGRFSGREDDMTCIEIAPGVMLRLRHEPIPADARVLVGLRAEDLILALEPPRGLSAQNVLAAVVREVVEGSEDDAAGGATLVLDLAGTSQSVLASLSRRSRHQMGLRSGLPVQVVFKAQACRVLTVL